MKENEEKNSCNQDFISNDKDNKEGLHYKKIQIKHIKKDTLNKNDINLDNQNKSKKNLNLNIINQNPNKNEIIKEDKNFMFEDINNQLDEILKNIDNDGIEEINQKIKLLNEDKHLFNTISYNDDNNYKYDEKIEKDLNYKKIDNTNKFFHKRNKILNDKNNINNYKHINQKNKHYMFDNRNITNNKYLFTSLNNTHRNWKEENNCNNDECDNYLNKTNISLFYKYNKLYNSKKSDEE